MAKTKSINISELINDYDENFISSISLNGISSTKELKELMQKLERANYVVTTFYETMYNDYMMMINSDCDALPCDLDIATLKKYKTLASKIQQAYSYVLYLHTFENPFKASTRKWQWLTQVH